MNLEIFSFSEKNKKEWDSFVLSEQTGSIHQISDWGKFQKTINGREKILGFGVKEKNSRKILATTFCVRMQIDFLKKIKRYLPNFIAKKIPEYWWYSARGPVFDLKNKEIGEFLISEIRKNPNLQKGIFWRFDPYFPPNYKLNIKTKKATQNYQPTDTLEIDLQKNDNEILAEMKRKGRYNINLAKKNNIKITYFTGQDFVKLNEKIREKLMFDFWKLNTETTGRDNFFGHEKIYYQNFLSNLPNFAVLFFAEFKGKKISTAITTFCRKKAIYYFGASTSDKKYRNLMSPYLLQWEMINFAKKQNCETYDFLGISPENEKNHPYAGISDFKWKFGGSRKTYQKGKEIVFNKFWWWVYKLFKKII